MWMMLQQNNPDDYIVATGEMRSVREFLVASLLAVGLEPDIERYVEFDPSMIRPAEVDLLVGDATKAREILGWKPTISFEQLVSRMVENDLQIESQN